MRDKIVEYLIGDGGPLRVRAILAEATTATVAYLWIAEKSVPDALVTAWAAIMAFYFATRSQQDKP